MSVMIWHAFFHILPSFQHPVAQVSAATWCIGLNLFDMYMYRMSFSKICEWTIDFGKTDTCQLVVCNRCGIQGNMNQKDVNFSLCEWIMNIIFPAHGSKPRQTKNTCLQPSETIMWNLLFVPEFSPSVCSESCTFRPSERWHFTVTAFQRRLCQVKESNHQWCCTAKVLKWRMTMDHDVMWIWCDVDLMWCGNSSWNVRHLQETKQTIQLFKFWPKMLVKLRLPEGYHSGYI